MTRTTVMLHNGRHSQNGFRFKRKTYNYEFFNDFHGIFRKKKSCHFCEEPLSIVRSAPLKDITEATTSCHVTLSAYKITPHSRYKYHSILRKADSSVTTVLGSLSLAHGFWTGRVLTLCESFPSSHVPGPPFSSIGKLK